MVSATRGAVANCSLFSQLVVRAVVAGRRFATFIKHCPLPTNNTRYHNTATTTTLHSTSLVRAVSIKNLRTVIHDVRPAGVICRTSRSFDKKTVFSCMRAKNWRIIVSDPKKHRHVWRVPVHAGADRLRFSVGCLLSAIIIQDLQLKAKATARQPANLRTSH